MSYLDPDERDGPAWHSRSSDGAGDNVEDTDIAFARIVAGLRAQGWQAPSEPPNSPGHDPDTDPSQDHFEPPEPPPLPVPRLRTVCGVVTVAAGVLLLAAPNLLDLGERAGTPLGLLAVTAGIGWLVIGLRPDPSAEGSDDGAQL